MSQDLIDPYAPPQTNVENKQPVQESEGVAYAEGKFMLITPNYIFPKICPKTGQDLTKYNIPSTKITLKVPRIWSQRPAWANALLILSAVIIGVGFIAGLERNMISIFIVAVGILLNHLVTRKITNRYDYSVYFSNIYLDAHKSSKRLFGILCFVVILFMLLFMGRFPVFSGYHFFWFIFVFIMSLVLYLLKSMHFRLVKQKNGFLYISGVNAEFLKKLPPPPLSS